MSEDDRIARKRKQTRDRIAAAAHTLFERDGYEGVTMEQIAAEADVARGTLYNHFPVKEAVLVHWMHNELEQDLQAVVEDYVLSRESFVARVATLWHGSASWWEHHRQYAAPYIRFRFQQVRDGMEQQASSDMLPLYVLLIDQAQQAGELRSDTAAARLAHYLHFLYLGAVMTWLSGADVRLEAELCTALDFFMQGAAHTDGTARSDLRKPNDQV
ncbi:Putative transcriptional Regulator, TetR family [Cupriavidus taiwanensis]|uniref:TetR/AcrR family transcriptional regulator n=1 Tax=Cupriavidus taiwanensis TaxID=164546 RepID=UPI000E195DBF|nr:TetR/AcrR family transcriptional regulator [Cupriavidus taiwanensis]SPA01654.1 Putative transcriptional Regulator, TetR family [Cupriavidus taiwanensis]